MAGRWSMLTQADTGDGLLELRHHDSGSFLITIDGRVLMDSHANRSETALAEFACSKLKRRSPRVLIGGLGMGCTLRAALDALPTDARVDVCELNETIVEWCRGPLETVSGGALADPRVRVKLGDVAALIAARAGDSKQARFDGILLDLYEGPRAGTKPDADPLYGSRALARTRQALAPRGVFAVWAEDPDAAFERRLGQAGFAVDLHRPGRGGRRHAVYLGTLKS